MSPDEISSLNIEDLLSLRRHIDQVLSVRRDQLEQQLRQIGGDLSSGAKATAKIAPRYRSRKDPKLQWSGRGALPRWMRAEMKGTKLTKDDFRIAS